MTAVARQPLVRLGYFPALGTLRFADFTRVEERIARGGQAYDIARSVGWAQVAACLDDALAAVDWTPAPARAAACPLRPWLAAA